MERLWNALFGKNYFVYAWSNCKPNEAGQLERDNISLSELIAYKTSGQLLSWWVGLQNHVGIFQYSCWMLCNLSVKFAVQNFTLMLQVTVEIHFSSFFWVGILGVFEPNFKAIGKVYIPYKFVQRRHICVKTEEVFFTSKFFPTIYIFGWLPVKICQHSEKLEIPMPIQLNRSILQSLGRLSSEDCLKP